MRGTYNESQMQAVTAGLDGSPLVLVQGPPGGGGRALYCTGTQHAECSRVQAHTAHNGAVQAS